MPRSVDITRYITPLREGSSLPALVEADDGREYVVKFRGAGHGEKALIAELVVFVNAGLVMFCRSRRFLGARASLDAARLAALRPDAELDALRDQLALVERIATGEVASGPLAGMSQSERFHWLTTPRSTAVQPGPIHGGMTDDPAATFEHLFATLVIRPEEQ